jgi:uncharacterized membrane protein
MGGVVRHFYNVRHQRLGSPWWTWGVAAVCGLLIMWLSTLGPATGERPRKRADAPAAKAISFAEVEEIVITRCSMCHAREPVWTGITVPPKGVLLDSAAHIREHAHDIAVTAAWSSAMPPSNITGLTAEEREALGAWAAKRRE